MSRESNIAGNIAALQDASYFTAMQTEMNASIIVPTRGGRATISTTLRSLIAAVPAGCRTEILVVDNNDDEDVSDQLRQHCRACGPAVQYLAETAPRPGPAPRCTGGPR
jgi:hypothetical protein